LNARILVHLLSTPKAKNALFSPIGAERARNLETRLTREISDNWKKGLEARVRIELTYKGFADLSLTTWVPRPTF
jgi:hypothetical protein